MAEQFLALGEMVAGARIAAQSPAAREAIDQAIRASLLCTLFGIEREQWVWPFPALARADASAAGPEVRMLAGLLEPLGGIARLATVAGASDLDPMDPGPSHSVLPATLAACIAQGLLDASAPRDDEAIASAVLAGIEASWQLRRVVTGARPGVGFHSPGVFGTLAASASASRLLGLDPQQCLNALAIALTRACGLAINSAASTIGMTHFGWGAAHGLEAALLASQGWGASQDFQRAMATLFGEDRVDVDRLRLPAPPAGEALVFKRYPCNIYLNAVVGMLEELKGEPVDRIELALPWVPHLDCAAPKDLRQARNSAQAVAAIAGAGDISYQAFSGAPGAWVPSPAVARLLPNVHLQMDREAPTSLRDAVLRVRAWRGGRQVLEAQRATRELRGWGAEHAQRLLSADPGDPAVQALYGGTYLQGFDFMRDREAGEAATRAALMGHRR